VALDAGTLVTALVVVCVVLACLLGISWAQSRDTPTFAVWVVAFGLAAGAGVVAAARHWLPGDVGINTSIALRLFALGLAWHAARRYTGQKTKPSSGSL
jgi:hypothetical protein